MKREALNVQDILNRIIWKRRIKNIEEFLHPALPYSFSLASFGFKKEIKKTLAILKEIKEKNLMIVVYTDYDADGITGGAILWETLHLLGFRVMPYVPDRKKEGYGFSVQGIDAVKKMYDPALIISVDHGITAKEKIAYARSLGIRVIVTDHHLKPDQLPTDAEAIFHIPELSGSGVSYFFSKEIYEYFASSPTTHYSLLTTHFSCDYLALAAIGTIADLVPLLGPSRSIAKYGLKAFSRIKRIGLKAIIKESGIEGKPITPYEVGFIIAPRINAIGRLEHALDALRLLCTKDTGKARELADKIGIRNRQRQDMVNTAFEEAKKIVNSRTRNTLIIVTSDVWHEGIIGLVASKIAEEYYRPTIVLTKNSGLPAGRQGFFKGSARSIPALHMTDFLRSLKKYLIDVGGHKAAAGFTIEKEKLSSFIETAQKKADKLLTERDFKRTIEIDLKIPLSSVTLSLAEALTQLEPFGIGNPRPLFESIVKIVDAKLFGRENNHLKLFLQDPESESSPIEFIAFSHGEKISTLAREQLITVIYSVEIDSWNRSKRMRGIVRSIES